MTGTRSSTTALTVVSFLFIVSFLLCLLAGWYGIPGTRTFVMNVMSIFALVAVFLLIKARTYPQTTESVLVILFLIWFTLTRLYHDGFGLISSKGRLIELVAAMAVMLPALSVMSKPTVEKLERVFSGILLTALFVFSCYAIVAVVREKMLIPPGTDMGIYIGPENRLVMMGRHPNLTSSVYTIGFLVSLYHLVRHWRQPLFVAASAVTCLSFYVVIALTVSRAGMINLAINVAIVTAIWLSRRLVDKKKPLRLAVAALSFLMVTAVVYGGYQMAIDGLAAMRRHVGQSLSTSSDGNNKPIQMDRITVGAFIQGAFAEPGEQTSTTSAPQNTAEEEIVASRPLGQDVISLNGRTGVYWAAIKTAFLNPKVLLVGHGDNFMSLVNRQLPPGAPPLSHTHNSFLQVMMSSGIIGLTLMVWFAFCLVRRAWRVVSLPGITLADIVMVTIPMAVLTHSLVEPLIFWGNSPEPNFLFFFYAGILIVRTANIKEGTERTMAMPIN